MKFFTLDEIFQNTWGTIVKENEYPKRTPAQWLKESDLTVHDVKLWEEIHYTPGVIGVYASWNPYEEFYIINHNLHNTLEIFYKNNPVDRVFDRCKDLGIVLDFDLIKS